MTPAQIGILIALLANVVLGLYIYLTNARRTANQAFLVLSLILSGWVFALFMGFRALSPEQGAFWIRQSNAVGSLIPLSFYLLLLALAHPDLTLAQTLRRARYWPYVVAAVFALCQTGFFLKGATIHVGQDGRLVVPEPEYGPGFLVYNLYALAILIYIGVKFYGFLRRARGIQRAELQFTLLGAVLCVFIGIVFGLLIPLFTGSSQTIQFAPANVAVLDAIIAYGIATRRIMDVGQFIRSAISHALSFAALAALYLLVWKGADAAWLALFREPGPLGHLLGALAVALAMYPAQGNARRITAAIFLSGPEANVQRTLQEASEILQSISTLNELLERFSRLAMRSVGTHSIHLLRGNSRLVSQAYPPPPPEGGVCLDTDSLVLRALAQGHGTVVRDLAQRFRPEDIRHQAGRQLRQLQFDIAVAIRSKDQLVGVMLLGPRTSGRIYGATQQQLLPLLANQLAVAIENAQLYTQVQESKIYNENLVDNLVSGVVAVNAEQVINVYNREAQRIIGLPPSAVLNHPASVLPAPLRDLLDRAFAGATGLRDQEIGVPGPQSETIPLRAGASAFLSPSGGTLGALLVFNDLTKLKKLEQQVRRTDRLASLGTLSAGMAHEIKNPLVTIKTFTDLLPDRYGDDEFREKFNELVGHEVRRIDAIVNQLLKFARPSKPDLRPTPLNQVVERTLRLTGQQLKTKGLRLEHYLDAGEDLVMGDADQIEQALVNFLLNATDSMDQGGTLTVSTSVVGPRGARPRWAAGRPEPRRLRITIADTGCGIEPEDVPHIFDPFFTTKSNGTGMGLAVAHGIIMEHQGSVDVDSRVGLGTRFDIEIPLCQEEVPA